MNFTFDPNILPKINQFFKENNIENHSEYILNAIQLLHSYNNIQFTESTILKKLYDISSIISDNESAKLTMLSNADYLTKSCHILPWFKQNYTFVSPTVKAVQPIHITKIYNSFKDLYFCNLTKNERRLYNLTYFRDYFKNNPYYKKFFKDRVQFNNTDYRSVIINHVLNN